MLLSNVGKADVAELGNQSLTPECRVLFVTEHNVMPDCDVTVHVTGISTYRCSQVFEKYYRDTNNSCCLCAFVLI